MVLALVLLVVMPVFVYCHPTGQQVLGGAGAASVLLVATLGGSVAGWLVGYRAPRLALSYGGVGGLVAAGGTVLLMQAKSQLFRRLGIYGAMVVGAAIGTGLYHATLKLRGDQGLKDIRTKRAIRAEQTLIEARARLPLYQALIHRMAVSSGCAREEAWRRFSEGFLRFGNVDEGLLSAFQSNALFARFDWRDLDGFQDLVSRVIEVIPSVQPCEFNAKGHDDPVGSGLRVLAKQLQARGYMLLNIGSDSDAYSCIVVRQEAAEEIIATNPPPGVQIRPL